MQYILYVYYIFLIWFLISILFFPPLHTIKFMRPKPFLWFYIWSHGINVRNIRITPSWYWVGSAEIKMYSVCTQLYAYLHLCTLSRYLLLIDIQDYWYVCMKVLGNTWVKVWKLHFLRYWTGGFSMILGLFSFIRPTVKILICHFVTSKYRF